MPQLAWTTDLHWDRMKEPDREAFKDWIRDSGATGLVFSGDLGEAPTVVAYLRELRDSLRVPIYFVLGNHDFYHGSFDAVRAAVAQMTQDDPGLRWLTQAGVVRLSGTTALVGHEGWADARFGDIEASSLMPRDFLWIQDLSGLPRSEWRDKLQALGDEAAASLRTSLSQAVAEFVNVFVVTHVPPFREACVDSCRICSPKKLPFYTCKAVGDMLLEMTAANPQCHVTVLCGHTHEECDLHVSANLHVRVKDAGYGNWYTPVLLDV